MTFAYKTPEERVPDTQYRNRLKTILETGDLIKTTPQGVGAITCFGTLSPMVYDLANGFPVLTERSMGNIWRKPIAEIIGFISGLRQIEEFERLGCPYWSEYKGKGKMFGLEPDDLGPGSYGAAFHDFPMPDGKGFNQLAHVIDQIKHFPYIRTLIVTPFIPFYIGRGGLQKAIVTPCHGMMHFRVIDGALDLVMWQRSADMPIGVPSNTIQYAALLLMVARVTGLRARRFIHHLSDAHIYENQVEKVEEILKRPSFRYPTLQLDPSVTNLFAFRPEHFALSEYECGESLKIPYSP